MSKIDLEPLVCLKRTRMDVERGNCEYNVTDYLDTIEAALIELKEIKETKTSEAMEDLNELEEVLLNQKLKYESIVNFNLDTIRDYILKSQKNEKEFAFFKKVKTMLKQKDVVLRYVESEDCFAVRTLLSDGWYKLTPEFVDNNVKEEIKPLPLIEKNVQLREENTEYKKVLEIIKKKDVDIKLLKECEEVEEYNAHFIIDEYQELTEKEFNLLKSYFEKKEKVLD